MRCHSRRIALAFVLSLLLGTACSSGGDSADAPPTTVGSTAAPTTTVAKEAAPVVVLDDPGAEPRQILLLRVRPGTRTTVTVENQIGIELEIDGTAAPATEAPGTTGVLEQVVESVDPDGTVHFSQTVVEVTVDASPGVDPEVAAESQATLDQLAGARSTGSIDVHGNVLETSLDASGVDDPLLSTTLESLSSQVGNLAAPFPREPVGVGARWTVTARATINGITMDTTSHYTLRALSGDRYELDFTQEGVAPPGPADLPGLPLGARATIRSFLMEGSGETIGDLTRHIPTSTTYQGTGDATMTLTVSGERTTLVQHLTIGSSLSAA